MPSEDLAVVEPPLRIHASSDYVVPEAGEHFVATPAVEAIVERALTYLRAGYPVHLAGPSGTGKTTLAMHIAAQLGRPVTLVHGDDEFSTSDLVGQDSGYKRSRLVDNYVRSVLKTEEEMRKMWVDNRLTTACRQGHVLVYDEFTRSRSEANNVLLSVFQERILNLPKLRESGQGYVRVHDQFRAILTSNPEEYAGTHKTPDALMDRMLTIHVGYPPRDTEVDITVRRSGLRRADAERIVDIVRDLRARNLTAQGPTIRAGVAIARVLAIRGVGLDVGDPFVVAVCHDVLLGRDSSRVMRDGESVMARALHEALERYGRGIAAVRDGSDRDQEGR